MPGQIVGIRAIKNIEDYGNFDSEKIVDAIYKNRDIILKVDSIKSDTFEKDKDTVLVYLNLKVTDKEKLIDGIFDLFKKFRATSVDLEYNKTRGTTHGIRILKFWWDRHDRLTNI